MEIVLKSIAYGFVLGHSKCYLRTPINMIDTAVVCVSVANIIMELMGHEHSVQLQVFRVLRVVRMLKVLTNLKRVIDCLLGSLQKIIYFLVLYLLIVFLYSIIGKSSGSYFF